MPQVDLSSVCAGVIRDRKVSCETLTGDGDDSISPPENHRITPQLDYAPESFCLSKDSELDWIDQNAFIERKNSAKGSHKNSISINPNPNPNSQRCSANLKSKVSMMIGLPKPQKPNYAEAKNRNNFRPANVRLFPKRSGSVSGKPAVALSEPSSPMVSCIGRVRSRKDRSRRRKKQNEPALVSSKSVKGERTGFWTNFRSIFGSGGHISGCKAVEPGVEPVITVVKKRSSLKKRGRFNSDSNCNNSCGSSSEKARIEPPGLCAVKRFSSGRRSDAWAADVVEVN